MPFALRPRRSILFRARSLRAAILAPALALAGAGATVYGCATIAPDDPGAGLGDSGADTSPTAPLDASFPRDATRDSPDLVDVPVFDPTESGTTPSDGGADGDAEPRGFRAAVSIAAKHGHVCAAMRDGSVFCWGTTEDNFAVSAIPVHVDFGDAGVTAVEVATGLSHACARTAAGKVYCWGADTSCSVGDGLPCIQGSHLAPELVQLPDGSALTSVVAIRAGYYSTCALRVGGELVCWGLDETLLVTPGALPQSASARHVFSGVHDIAVGATSACLAWSDGGIACYGDGEYGELGKDPNTLGTCVTSWDASHPCSATPVPIAVPFAASGVVGEGYAYCATKTGMASCWGANLCGELGVAPAVAGGCSATSFIPFTAHPAPIAILQAPPIAVDIVPYFGCAIAGDDRRVYCWGSAEYGALGHDRATDPASAVLLPDDTPLVDVDQIVTGRGFGCAITSTGDLYCWGSTADGAIGVDVPSGLSGFARAQHVDFPL